MNKSKILILGLVALLVVAYAVWTTVRIAKLESRLAQLESSHQAVVRATYAVGTASLPEGKLDGLSGAGLAKYALLEMEQDDLLRPAIYRSRTRSTLIRESQSPHNSVDKVSQ